LRSKLAQNQPEAGWLGAHKKIGYKQLGVLTRLPSMTNRQIKDVVPKALAAARRNTALWSSLNIVNVVTQTYDVYSSIESIYDRKALGVTLTFKRSASVDEE